MAEPEPWGGYSRATLPRGWAYVLGRDAIERGLRDAGASVGSLSLGAPDIPPRTQALTVFGLYWYGDARAGWPRDRNLMLMRWTGLPVAVAGRIAGEVERVQLPRGCAWAAGAPRRGNAWSASEHDRRLVLDEDTLRATETQAPAAEGAWAPAYEAVAQPRQDPRMIVSVVRPTRRASGNGRLPTPMPPSLSG